MMTIFSNSENFSETVQKIFKIYLPTLFLKFFCLVSLSVFQIFQLNLTKITKLVDLEQNTNNFFLIYGLTIGERSGAILPSHVSSLKPSD